MPNTKTETFTNVSDLSKLKTIMGKKLGLSPKDVQEDWDKLNNGYNAWNEKVKRVVGNKVKVELRITYYPDLVAEKDKYNKITRVSAHWGAPSKEFVIFENRNLKAPTTVD